MSTTTESSQARMAASTATVSATVLAGFDDSTHRARTRWGWSAVISSASVLGGSSPAMYSWPVISDRCPLEFAHRGCSHECRVLVPGRPKLPVTR
jgi:hypothetical protein